MRTITFYQILQRWNNETFRGAMYGEAIVQPMTLEDIAAAICAGEHGDRHDCYPIRVHSWEMTGDDVCTSSMRDVSAEVAALVAKRFNKLDLSTKSRTEAFDAGNRPDVLFCEEHGYEFDVEEEETHRDGSSSYFTVYSPCLIAPRKQREAA